MLKSHTREDIQVVGLAYAAFVVLGLPGGLLGVGWPSIQETFGVRLDAVGILLLASTTGYLISSFFSGQLVSRFGIGKVMIISCLMSGVGLLGYAIAPVWWFMVAIGLLTGIGTGLKDAGLNIHFARTYSPRLMNWLHACFGLGAAVGPLLMTNLISSQISWRVAYVSVAILEFALALCFIVTLNRWRSASPASISEDKPHKTVVSIGETLRQPLVWMSILVFMLVAGIELTIGQWTYIFFTDARGINLKTAGEWVSFYWASFTIGRVFFGIIGNRINVIREISLCMLFLVIGAVLIWLNTGSILNLIGVIVMGFTLGPIFPLLTSATPERLGDAHATNAIGFQVSAAGIGVGLMPALAGVIADRSGLETIPIFLIVASIIMFTNYLVISTRKLELAPEAT